MPRYFFYLVRKGVVIPDYEGTELSDVDEAHREAVLTALDLMIRILRTDEPFPPHDSVHVIDERGSKVVTVTLKEALG
jgi:hypothetical protein